jgi:tRNA dimethylallyltransferase
MRKPGIPILVGPTASGKTDVSLRIAERTSVEILSADSRQVYRHMDIGTAKPSEDERRRVPHHCIDIADPDAVFSAGQYGILARRIVHDILSGNKTALGVGGSGLYIRALVDGIFHGNFRDEEVRRRLSEETDGLGLEAMHRRLRVVDPDAAGRIHVNDRKRIIRALEVCAISGRPLSRLQKEGTEPADFNPLFFGLNWPREVLYDRIERRVDRMMDNGFVDEVRKLKESGYSPAHNALDSVGYREIFQHLDGRINLEETVALIKRNTRRFAKRQMTWFRSDHRIEWIEVSDSKEFERIADRIVHSVFHFAFRSAEHSD